MDTERNTRKDAFDFLAILFLFACVGAGVEVGYLLSPTYPYFFKSQAFAHMSWGRVFANMHIKHMFWDRTDRVFIGIQSQTRDNVISGGIVGFIFGGMVNLIRK